jgi:hypothetical protein
MYVIRNLMSEGKKLLYQFQLKLFNIPMSHIQQAANEKISRTKWLS